MAAHPGEEGSSLISDLESLTPCPEAVENNPDGGEFDVVIVGAGPAGIYCAYELAMRAPSLSVALVDKGHDIYMRKCPIKEHKIKKCPSLKPGRAGCFPACSITNGFGGAGAYSDGKFNITHQFGGWLTEYLGDEEVERLINYVDEINLKYGAPDRITDPTTEKVMEIERKAYSAGLKLLRAKVRHLGTEVNLEILKRIYKELEDKVNYYFRTEVEHIIVHEGHVEGVKLLNGSVFKCKKLFVAPGRDGSNWLKQECTLHDIKMSNLQVDIGVRVETSDIVMKEINDNLYEGKFIFRTSVGTEVRTFCSNPSGHVVIENHSGTMLANGHAYSDERLGSHNTNFALLVSHKFGEPFNEPNEYAECVSQLANKLSNGGIIVQKYGDILRGRRTTDKRLKEGFITPTLKEAIPGDLGLVLPYNTMKSLIEMTNALNYVTPGISSEHTLFYGAEAKFYSARPETNSNFETEVSGFYCGGDGAGITRGLAEAESNGVYVARHIIKTLLGASALNDGE